MPVIKILTKDDLIKSINESITNLKEIGLKNDIFDEGDLRDNKYLKNVLEKMLQEEWELDYVSSYLEQLKSSLFLAGFENKLPHAKCCSDEVDFNLLASEINLYISN